MSFTGRALIYIPFFFSFHHFRLSHYPYRLDDFTKLLDTLSGPKATHTIYGDFKPIGEIRTPAYYIHVIKKIP